MRTHILPARPSPWLRGRFLISDILLVRCGDRRTNSRGEHMKNVCKVAAALATLALAACGGGAGNAALSKTFNYGAPQAPSTAEQTAASSAQSTTVSSTSTF